MRSILCGRMALARRIFAPITDEWRELAARALEPNVFYEPAFALAGRGRVRPRCRRGFGLVGHACRAGCSAFFRRASTQRRYGLTAAGAGRLDASPMRRSARRWSSAKRRSRSSPPGSRILPAIRRCPDWCCCRSSPRTARSRRRSAAILRRAQMPCADFARHRRALLAPRTTARSYLEHVTFGAPAAGAAPQRAPSGRSGRAVVHGGDRAHRGRSRRSRISSRSRRAAGKAKPAPRRPSRRGAKFHQNGAVARSRRKAKSRSIASFSMAVRSPPRSRCAAATVPGTGKPLMTRSSRALRPGVLLTCGVDRRTRRGRPTSRAPIPAPLPATRCSITSGASACVFATA